MGNSGLRKLFFPGDIVESQYKSIHEIKVLGLNKEEISLGAFSKDKMTLIVNTGSQNPMFQDQIAQLNALKAQNSSSGLEILAFPCNQFHNEPFDYATTSKQYTQAAQFPVLQKLEVNGQFTHPLYKFLKRHSELFNLKLLNAGKITEDFSKFLVNQAGQVVCYYPREIPFTRIQADIDSIRGLSQNNVKAQQ